MQDICKIIGDHNRNKKREILTIFDDIMTDMISNKKNQFSSN